jgi:hypothetical protein
METSLTLEEREATTICMCSRHSSSVCLQGFSFDMTSFWSKLGELKLRAPLSNIIFSSIYIIKHPRYKLLCYIGFYYRPFIHSTHSSL